jgi:RNA polymerase sigma factor (sigma-70 family)
MAGASLDTVLSHLHRHAAACALAPCSDTVLLERFVTHRDEAAFTALVERHGPMVLGVCRRVLRNPHDAEDACQAAFLILARKADGIGRAGALGGWLHAVAFRVACRLRARRTRREAAEHPLTDSPAPSEPTWREARAALDEELQRLPEKWRTPLVLCYLEGKTRDEAARQLGWSVGTLRGRLARGRALLRTRLARRGLYASVSLAAALAPDGTASALSVATTVRAVLGPAPTPRQAEIIALAEEVMRTMSLSRITVVASVLLAVLVSVGLGATAYRDSAGEQPKLQPASQVREKQPPANQAAPAQLLDTWIPLELPVYTRPDDFQKYQVEITKNRITFLQGDEQHAFTYQVDPTKKSLDLTPVGGGRAIPAIYSQDGDYLQICFDGWQGKNRPRAFTRAKELGGQTLLLLKRAQPRTASAETDVVRKNLAAISVALFDHAQDKGTLPPAAFHNKAGKALLSWRVSLLPYVQQKNLYRLVKHDEPWDSANNQNVSQAVLRLYSPARQFPGLEFPDTLYRTFVGPGTAFDTKKGRKLTDVLAGGVNPILVVETAAATNWAQPGEFEYDPKRPLPKLGGVFDGGFHALFADGSVRFIPSKIEEKALRQLIAPPRPEKNPGARPAESDPDQAGKPATDNIAVTRLLGTWIPLPSRPLIRSEDFQNCRAEITNDRITFHTEKGKRVYRYSADPTRNPPALELTPEDGSAQDGKSVPAIYSLDGDYLQICFDGWDSNRRPRAFVTTAGAGGRALFLLKRDGSEPDVAGKVADYTRQKLAAIGLALYDYDRDQGSLPPAASHDRDGAALSSWRVALLPYLGDKDRYVQVRQDEPWDSAGNKPLLHVWLVQFAPSPLPQMYKFGETGTRLFVGPGTAFDFKKGRRLADVTAGGANPALVVEVAIPTPWAQPGELIYDPDRPLPRLASGEYTEGFYALFADGSVRLLPSDLGEKELRRLIAPAAPNK